MVSCRCSLKSLHWPMISWMNAGDGLGIWMAHCFPRGLAALHRQCSELYGLFQRKNIMDGKLKAAARDLVGIWLGSGEPREAPNMTWLQEAPTDATLRVNIGGRLEPESGWTYDTRSSLNMWLVVEHCVYPPSQLGWWSQLTAVWMALHRQADNNIQSSFCN